MPTVISGTTPMKVSWLEYFFALLPKDTPIEWKSKKSSPRHREAYRTKDGCGVFQFSYDYDGITASIIDAAGKQVSINGNIEKKSLTAKRLRDMRRLPGFGINGDGI